MWKHLGAVVFCFISVFLFLCRSLWGQRLAKEQNLLRVWTGPGQDALFIDTA